MAIFPPGLVWLASFPKSGNTWLRVLFANLRAGAAGGAHINRLEDDDGDYPGSKDWLVERTQVDPDLLGLAEIERLRARVHDAHAPTATILQSVKIHDALFGVSGAPIAGTVARAILYAVRDPRDVAVSAMHHFGLTADAAVALLDGEHGPFGGGRMLPYRLGDWSSHVRDWTGYRAVPVVNLRYEDLRAEPEHRFAAVLAALGVAADAAEIATAVARSSLAALQRQEEETGFSEARLGQARFFRSGRVGEWREVLSPAQVAAIEARHGAVMRRFGYLPAEEDPSP